MPCVVCNSVDVKKRCIDCADPLCAEHATACSGCGKALCPEHVQRTPGGRILCNTCMQARNDRHRARREEHGGEAAAPKPKAEAFSFQDLMSDMPPLPSATEAPSGPLEGGMGVALSTGQKGPREGHPAGGVQLLEDVPDPDVDRKLAQMLGEEVQSVRVLSGSAHKTRPMWIGSTFLGVITMGICAYVPLNHAYNSFQPLGSYIVIVLSIGTLVWAVSGLRNESDTPAERKLNWIGLLLALAAGILAFLHRGAGAA